VHHTATMLFPPTLDNWSEYEVNNTVIVPCPPYSPNFSLSNLALFLKLKLKLYGWHPKGVASGTHQH
jgi:hypothetical protein